MLNRPRRAAVVAGVLALSLFAGACGGSSDDSGTAASTTAAKATETTASGASTTGKATPTTQAKITAELKSSGATFPKAFYEQALADYKKVQPGVTQAYGAGGSGKGRQDFADQLVDWAGTDGLVKEEDKPKYKGGEFLYIPTVAAPITVAYNAPVDKLQLSADTIAKIFQAQITNWNDAAIAADNPGAKLPDKAIAVARRSDGSGTTENFTKFLVAASPSVWTLKSGSTVEWPASTQGGNGNAGVGQIVKATEGAIGYVDYSDAKALGLKFASIKNKAGKFVAPSLEATSAALEGAEVKADLTYNPLWAAGDASYPIAAPTWIIVYKTQTDKAKAQALKSWLRYVLTDGQKLAPSIDYAPLSKGLDEKALAAVDAIVVPS